MNVPEYVIDQAYELFSKLVLEEGGGWLEAPQGVDHYVRLARVAFAAIEGFDVAEAEWRAAEESAP